MAVLEPIVLAAELLPKLLVPAEAAPNPFFGVANVECARLGREDQPLGGTVGAVVGSGGGAVVGSVVVVVIACGAPKYISCFA